MPNLFKKISQIIGFNSYKDNLVEYKVINLTSDDLIIFI